MARGEISAVIIAGHDRLARDLEQYREIAGEWGRVGVAPIIAGGSTGC